MSQREFDVVVFGATGFTGRLVAEYLNQQYGPSVRWAMAGRSADKLAAVRDEIAAPADTALITADSSDAASLKALAARTKVLITTVGPYQNFGEPMVAACVEAGTDYVDLCGEPAWMHDIIRTYDAPARAWGAPNVRSWGFYCNPVLIGVYV
ncbi:MAG: saccharopine dehydrogenase NADP-binding domain-containing protein, partial [Oceanicaulis sp.]|nr:saccharopine dehydrogenase NADP-binding domain-containing protein [Oceanicaulis sp.]